MADRPATALKTAIGGTGLFQWGPVQFHVWPLNVHEYDHTTATEYARKDVAGAPPPREWVGEDDEQIFFRGNVFPRRIGGLPELEWMDDARESGKSYALVRGDGTKFGWFVIEKLMRTNKFLIIGGVAQVINFEALFTRVDVPRDASATARIWT